MSERIELSGLNVAVELQHFIETQALPGTGVEPSAFWSGLADQSGLRPDFEKWSIQTQPDFFGRGEYAWGTQNFA